MAHIQAYFGVYCRLTSTTLAKQLGVAGRVRLPHTVVPELMDKWMPPH